MGDREDDSHLSLSAASKLLGVHSTTLRRWADAGAVPVYITPGGHRRFVRSDVEALAARRPFSTRALGREWAARALAQARSDVAATDGRPVWLARIDEADRAAWRQIGQQLMGVVLHYINNPHDNNDLLAEARRIGGSYALLARRAGMPLTAAIEAALFFRDSLVDAAMQVSDEVHPRAAESARLLRRLSRVSNEVHLAVAAAYELPG
jgi:excisionase family DNA binding protein